MIMQPLISHEIPKQLFFYHHWFNDYPYVLAHLCHSSFKTYDKEYATFYKNVIKEYDYSILDNSAFELGDSINLDILYELGEEFKPTHLIVPDAFHNFKLTQERCIEYLGKYGKKSTPKLIGVLQGKTLQEIVQLQRFYETIQEIDIIAIPFDIFPDLDMQLYNNRILRATQFNALVNARISNKKYHLLGCSHPNEFEYYKADQLNCINSVDTSAPIIYGWNKVKFENNGLPSTQPKPKEKLADNLNIKLDNEQLQIIAHNIRTFKKLFNGNNN